MRSAAIARSSGGAVPQNDAELVAGKTAQRVFASHQLADAPANCGDQLVGSFELIRLIDPRQVVHRDQEEAAGRTKSYGILVEFFFEEFHQVRPVELAGKAVVAGEIVEPAFAFVALVDNAHHAMCARWLAVTSREPAAGILYLKLLVRPGVRPDAILDARADAAAAVALLGLHDRIKARLRILLLDQLRVGAAAGDCRGITDQQNVAGVRALHLRTSLAMSQR